MSDDLNGANTPTNPPKKDLPPLRPHLQVVRQIIYRGYAPSVEAILQDSLPDGVYLSEDGTVTIDVKSAPAEAEQPHRIQVVKKEIHERALSRMKDAPRILSPHNLRPV